MFDLRQWKRLEKEARYLAKDVKDLCVEIDTAVTDLLDPSLDLETARLIGSVQTLLVFINSNDLSFMADSLETLIESLER